MTDEEESSERLRDLVHVTLITCCVFMMMMTRVRVSLQTAPPLAVGQPSHTVTSLTDTQTIRLYHHDHHGGDDDDDDDDDEHVKNLNKSS